MMETPLQNYINGRWVASESETRSPVIDPATAATLAEVPAGSRRDIDAAVAAAAAAWPAWRRTPAGRRIQYLFRMKQVLEQNAEEIARICTRECGKTFAESKGEMVRAIENIETACGIPILMQSEFSEDIASGVDEFMIRQPLGVCACIAPFNFPIMIPFWFLPYALACGNTYLVKPSDRTPMSAVRIFELLESVGLPPGVLNLVHGGKPAVDALLEHPEVPAISFVGSTGVARYVYSQGAAHGKRIQAQGGAKNAVVILPDAEEETTVRIIADSAFGCAGQRCLAASLVILVGEAQQRFTPLLVEAARGKTAGNGLDPTTQMGPVISGESRERIEQLIAEGLREGATPLLDGRRAQVAGYENGFFLQPTVLGGVRPGGVIHRTEIFGPVLGLMQAECLEEAIGMINGSCYGNAASLFTRSGAAARRFRYEVQAGNIGVNIGIAAPMAYFPFSGWKQSFFGDLHGQSRHAVEFYTQTKVVVERWHEEWTRKF